MTTYSHVKVRNWLNGGTYSSIMFDYESDIVEDEVSSESSWIMDRLNTDYSFEESDWISEVLNSYNIQDVQKRRDNDLMQLIHTLKNFISLNEYNHLLYLLFNMRYEELGVLGKSLISKLAY